MLLPAGDNPRLTGPLKNSVLLHMSDPGANSRSAGDGSSLLALTAEHVGLDDITLGNADNGLHLIPRAAIRASAVPSQQSSLLLSYNQVPTV